MFDKKKNESSNLGLGITMDAVQELVTQWHSRELAAPDIPAKTPLSKVRYTPSFRSDKGPLDKYSVQYTAKSISEVFGNCLGKKTRTAHLRVRLALQLLELLEKQIIDDAQVRQMFQNRDYTLEILYATACAMNREIPEPRTLE